MSGDSQSEGRSIVEDAQETMRKHQNVIESASEKIEKVQTSCSHEWTYASEKAKCISDALPSVLVRTADDKGSRFHWDPAPGEIHFSVKCKHCLLKEELSVPNHCPKCLSEMTKTLIGRHSLDEFSKDGKEGQRQYKKDDLETFGWFAYRCSSTQCGFVVVYKPPPIREER